MYITELFSITEKIIEFVQVSFTRDYIIISYYIAIKIIYQQTNTALLFKLIKYHMIGVTTITTNDVAIVNWQ